MFFDDVLIQQFKRVHPVESLTRDLAHLEIVSADAHRSPAACQLPRQTGECLQHLRT